jgi:hypothetical protein
VIFSSTMMDKAKLKRWKLSVEAFEAGSPFPLENQIKKVAAYKKKLRRKWKPNLALQGRKPRTAPPKPTNSHRQNPSPNSHAKSESQSPDFVTSAALCWWDACLESRWPNLPGRESSCRSE